MLFIAVFLGNLDRGQDRGDGKSSLFRMQGMFVVSLHMTVCHKSSAPNSYV